MKKLYYGLVAILGSAGSFLLIRFIFSHKSKIIDLGISAVLFLIIFVMTKIKARYE